MLGRSGCRPRTCSAKQSVTIPWRSIVFLATVGGDDVTVLPPDPEMIAQRMVASQAYERRKLLDAYQGSGSLSRIARAIPRGVAGLRQTAVKGVLGGSHALRDRPTPSGAARRAVPRRAPVVR